MVIKLKLLFNTEVLTFELKRHWNIFPFRTTGKTDRRKCKREIELPMYKYQV